MTFLLEMTHLRADS